ncbi:hypothetical protein B0H14DRAFT_2560193 [Mycena olivaceomarginata]|nr:hypothetical protein B0H14DRAFT_2560193 [Mycena olivaceomarginata]
MPAHTATVIGSIGSTPGPGHRLYAMLRRGGVEVGMGENRGYSGGSPDKTLEGPTVSGNAVLLMHDLMTVREICHAIKHGHPERVKHMLKYWTPVFYAGGSFNHANESMELLHNLIHDWPADISPILCAGMFMNNQGKPAKFKETDIRVEHFNKDIKSHTSGVNARPQLLEKITPAIGYIQELTERMFQDLGVEDENQYHAKSDIFNFAWDKTSNHFVVDLYQIGLHKLAGKDGGHEQHLRHHILRSQSRHNRETPIEPNSDLPNNEQDNRQVEEELIRLDCELELDNEHPQLTLLEQLDALVQSWEEEEDSESGPVY